MSITIKNLTNSPYRIRMSDGSDGTLPSRGEIDGANVSDASIKQLKACGYIRITDGNPEAATVEPVLAPAAKIRKRR